MSELKDAKREVDIRIESSSQDQHIVQSVHGDLYHKDDAVYIRYPEPDPTMGTTTTTVKIKDNTIKVMRHGDVHSEQTFSKHQKEWGIYGLAQGNLQLVTETHSLDIELDNGIGTVAWSYSLWASGDAMGSFNLQLEIQEVIND